MALETAGVVAVILRAERLAKETVLEGTGVVLVVAVHRERENTTSQRVDMARR